MTQLVVLHHGAIGDFVLALSVVEGVRDCLGSGNVTAIASAPSAGLAAGRSAIDEHLLPEQVGLHSLFREDGPLDDRLNELLCRTDCVLSFLGDGSSAIHRRLMEVTTGHMISIDPRPTDETLRTRSHITSQWAAAVRQAGIPISEPTPAVIRLDPSRDSAAKVDAPRRTPMADSEVGRYELKNGQDTFKRVVIHPGSGGREKCWPLERFMEVADELDGAHITWLVGPAESESRADEVATLRRRTAEKGEVLLVESNLTAAACRVAEADLYLGNDAGMTHVAAALGVPVVAIFGPTDPRVWRPLGNHMDVVEPPARKRAITDVTVEQVLLAVSHRKRSSSSRRCAQ